MRAVGIIAEYNPFHNGHAFQAAEARRLSGADCVIAVMSGQFTQRGEAALVDKWTRASGVAGSAVDLLIELPTVFSVRSAQYFAAGGVRLLNSLGIVDALSFGAETPDTGLLYKAAAALDEPGFIRKQKEAMRKGTSYAAALSETLATQNVVPEAFILSPNNILGCEYVRAIQTYASAMQVYTVLRTGAGHHAKEITGTIASAGAIRKSIFEHRSLHPIIRSTMPSHSWNTLVSAFESGWGPADSSRLDSAVLTHIRRATIAALSECPEISEGLEYRVKQMGQRACSIAELLDLISCKRYPRSRLRRLLTHLLLGTTRTMLQEFDRTGPLYARVLYAGKTGRDALHQIRKTASIPIITKLANHLHSKDLDSNTRTPLQKMLAIDILATDVFSLTLPDVSKRKGGYDYTRTPSCRE